jgi:hypothetical protein|tara:strand:- start:436 stop:585 length:150 start_codon:yes stop_codon:yes gene_type:complete
MNNYTEEYQSDFDYSGEWTDKDDILSTLEEETIRDNYDSETMTLIKEFR